MALFDDGTALEAVQRLETMGRRYELARARETCGELDLQLANLREALAGAVGEGEG